MTLGVMGSPDCDGTQSRETCMRAVEVGAQGCGQRPLGATTALIPGLAACTAKPVTSDMRQPERFSMAHYLGGNHT